MRSLKLPVMLAAAVAVALTGCTTMGTGYGTVRGADHGRVSFDWKSVDDVSGSLTATLSDGEMYSGRYFQITRDTRVDTIAPLWAGWSPRWRGWPGWYADPGPDFIKQYSGRVVANLSAADGEHMRCRFQLVHPTSGMKGGGQGTCQFQDGKSVDAMFPSV
jgi:hypothetical protein